jgi:hypothetical protein
VGKWRLVPNSEVFTAERPANRIAATATHLDKDTGNKEN